MKKSIIFCLLIILTIFTIVGYKCNNKTHKFKLRIKESSWSGWTEDYKPEELTKEYEVVLGEVYSINSGKFIFSILEINDDNIIIETSEPFSDKEGGIDLKTKKTKFKIYIDQEIELNTPTMDAGEIYYLTLLK